MFGLIALIALAAATPTAQTPSPTTGTAVIAAVAPAIKPDLTKNPSLDERAWIAAVVYRTVKQYFAHWGGLPSDYNFDREFRAYLLKALAAPDRRSFSIATTKLIASLRNGHTFFADPALLTDPRPTLFYAEPVEDRWTVTVSRTADLAPGDVIQAIDGVPIGTWVRPIQAIIGQSSEQARDHLVFLRTFMFPQRFTLQLADGRRVHVDENAPRGPRRGRPRPEEVTVQHRPDGVVVIAIPSFDDPHFEADAVRAVKASTGAPLILLDVRGNSGGSTPNDLLKALMTKPYAGTVVATPLTIAENDAHGSFSPDDNPAPDAFLRYGPDRSTPDLNAYPGPVALLVDRECASACEDFAIRFKSGARGLVLGEATWGSTGQPIQALFPELGMTLRVSTKRESFADGSRFEGVGVTPDIAIPLTRTDLTTQGDLYLERAIQAARSRTN